jgi:N utilization substance protein B
MVIVMEKVTRTDLRNYIMTILYQVNVYDKNKIEYDIKDVIKDVYPIDNEFIDEIVMGVINNKKDIDSIANRYLEGWKIDRLGNTDQAILRMAIYEMLYTDTPGVVVIDEAVRLAKSFSDDDVRKMINGVLDKIFHEGVKDE